MKKFYAFAAVAFMTLAANAQNGAPLYAAGAGDFVNGTWNAGTPDLFVYADGKYTMEVANLTQFKISTTVKAESEVGDGWAQFGNGVLGCNYGDTPGVAVPLEAGYGDNIKCPWKGDYTIVVAGDLSTITLSTNTPKPTEEAPIYLRGAMNGWGANDAWTLTKIGENVYSFTCADGQAVLAAQIFKIGDADWNAVNVGGDGNVMDLNTVTTVYNGGNPADMRLSEAWDGILYLDLTPDACQIFLSNNKDAENPFGSEIPNGVANVNVDENAPAVYYNLQGVRVDAPENGLYIVVKGGKTQKVLVK